MTAAAMTWSSTPVPRPFVAAFRRADVTAAATAASMPIRTKVFMIVSRVLMPARLGGLRVAADGERRSVRSGGASPGTSWPTASPSAMRTGDRDPRRDLQAARRDPGCRAPWRTPPRGRAATGSVGDPHGAQRPTRLPATPSVTSAQSGRSGKPYRRRRRRRLDDEAVDDRHDPHRGDEPAQDVAERTLGPAAEQLERRVERARSSGPRELERGAAPDEQAAEGHDERGDPDVGDEEARAGRRSARRGRCRAQGERSRGTADRSRGRGYSGSIRSGASAMTMAVKARIDPIDRSMLRDTMISTMPGRHDARRRPTGPTGSTGCAGTGTGRRTAKLNTSQTTATAAIMPRSRLSTSRPASADRRTA